MKFMKFKELQVGDAYEELFPQWGNKIVGFKTASKEAFIVEPFFETLCMDGNEEVVKRGRIGITNPGVVYAY